MARASLAGKYPSDWALAGAFCKGMRERGEAASEKAAHRRLYDKFRRQKGELIARVNQEV
jgi:hypothetical protein